MTKQDAADNPGADAVAPDGFPPLPRADDHPRQPPPDRIPPAPTGRLPEEEARALTEALVARRPRGVAGYLLTGGYQPITPEQLRTLLGMGFGEAEWLTRREAAGLIEQQ